MLKHWRIGVAVLAGFVVGQLNPIGIAYWKLAEWRLPQIRAESLAHPTPFESIPRAKWVGETANTIAFDDINRNAPVHILVIPKQHFASIATPTAEESALLGHLLASTAKIAEQQNLAKGYRIVINTGPDGGQTVDHLHLHLLGGRHMGWPPG